MARDDLVRADDVEVTQVGARLARESEESRVSQPAAAERAQVLDAARRADDSFDRDVGQCVAVAHAEVRQRGRDERQARRAAWRDLSCAAPPCVLCGLGQRVEQFAESDVVDAGASGEGQESKLGQRATNRA